MILLTPGPTPIPPKVAEALAKPAMPHRSPAFRALQEECDFGLQRIFRTTDPVLTIAGSSTAAFEAAQLSLIGPGEKALCCVNGKFSARWRTIYERWIERAGLEVIDIEEEWGRPVNLQRFDQTLQANPDVRVITLAHNETSTATTSDLQQLAAIARERAPEAILIADCVSALAAIPVETDAWGVDVVITGSQKALMLPPGLGFVSISARAAERLNELRDRSLSPHYLDLAHALDAWPTRSSPFTPAINLMYALRASLKIIEDQGIEDVWARTRTRADAVRSAFTAMGLALCSSAPSDAVTAVRYPEGLDDRVRSHCERESGVIVAGGQGPWKGRVLRCSHMGWLQDEDVIAGVDAVAAALSDLSEVPEADIKRGCEEVRHRLASGVG